MKLFWKWTAAALAAGICACNFAFPSVSAKTEDSSSNVYLCDEGDFLLDSEFQTAMEELQNAADESGMNVALWIGNTEIGDGSDEDTVAFCDDTYEELYGIDTDGCIPLSGYVRSIFPIRLSLHQRQGTVLLQQRRRL